MNAELHTRETFFDNYKAFLIICVVVGHFLDHFTSKFVFADILRIFIYFFHIPAFSFISGYFARKNNFPVLIRKLILPYLFFQSIYYFLYHSLGYNVGFDLFSPFFTLWYLVALFTWRLIIDRLSHIKKLIPLAVICSILIGFIPVAKPFVDLYRIISFFPFFAMGHQFNKQYFTKLCQLPYIKLMSAALLGTVFLVICIFPNLPFFDIPVLNCQNSYTVLGMEETGWIFRTTYIALSTAMLYAIAFLIPKQKMLFTFLGQYTMRVYLCHGVVYKFLSLGTDALDAVHGHIGLAMYIGAVILLAFSLSLVPIEKIISYIIEIPHRIFNAVKQIYT